MKMCVRAEVQLQTFLISALGEGDKNIFICTHWTFNWSLNRRRWWLSRPHNGVREVSKEVIMNLPKMEALFLW